MSFKEVVSKILQAIYVTSFIVVLIGMIADHTSNHKESSLVVKFAVFVWSVTILIIGILKCCAKTDKSKSDGTSGGGVGDGGGGGGGGGCGGGGCGGCGNWKNQSNYESKNKFSNGITNW